MNSVATLVLFEKVSTHITNIIITFYFIFIFIIIFITPLTIKLPTHTNAYKLEEASYDSFVIDRIDQSEGLWFAGGNQWNYYSFWKDTPVHSAIKVCCSIC